jgi:hypothetical protein
MDWRVVESPGMHEVGESPEQEVVPTHSSQKDGNNGEPTKKIQILLFAVRKVGRGFGATGAFLTSLINHFNLTESPSRFQIAV